MLCRIAQENVWEADCTARPRPNHDRLGNHPGGIFFGTEHCSFSCATRQPIRVWLVRWRHSQGTTSLFGAAKRHVDSNFVYCVATGCYGRSTTKCWPNLHHVCPAQTRTALTLLLSVVCRGAPTGGGRGPPWDLKNTMFSGFLPLNYVIWIFEVCFLKLFAMWEDWGSLQYGW